MTTVLVLTEPASDPLRRVGGVPIALRLAKDAATAGVDGIVVRADEPHRGAIVRALSEAPGPLPPVMDEPPERARRVVVAASTVMHRRSLAELVGSEAFRSLPPGATRDLDEEPFSADVPYGFDPVLVADAKSAQRAERLLFRSLRKPADGWTSRYLNRYLSLAVSRVLVRTPLSPNQISFGILAIGLTGAWFASRGSYWDLVIGALLFHAQSVLDGCDGEISRITYRGSLAGEWLDTVGDDLTNYAFFGAAGYGLYQHTGHWWYAVAGGVAVGCGVIASGIEYRYLIKIGSGDLLKYPLSQGDTGSSALSAIQPLFKRDTFVFLTFLASLAGLVGPMLVLFALGAIGVLGNVLAAEVRMARADERP